MRVRLKEAGINCLSVSSAKDYGLDDRYMFDGIHAGEIYVSYIVEDLVRHAPRGSLLATIDLDYLSNLRAKDHISPLSFDGPGLSGGLEK